MVEENGSSSRALKDPEFSSRPVLEGQSPVRPISKLFVVLFHVSQVFRVWLMSSSYSLKTRSNNGVEAPDYILSSPFPSVAQALAPSKTHTPMDTMTTLAS